MAKLDNRKRVIALKSVRLFSSTPTGGTQYAQRIDGAIFVRKLKSVTHTSSYVSYSKWARLDDKKLADFLRSISESHYPTVINGVYYDARATTRLKLPQDLGV